MAQKWPFWDGLSICAKSQISPNLAFGQIWSIYFGPFFRLKPYTERRRLVVLQTLLKSYLNRPSSGKIFDLIALFKIELPFRTLYMRNRRSHAATRTMWRGRVPFLTQCRDLALLVGPLSRSLRSLRPWALGRLGQKANAPRHTVRTQSCELRCACRGFFKGCSILKRAIKSKDFALGPGRLR